MTGWVVAAAGAGVAAMGFGVAVATTTLSRQELARWVSQRLRGFSMASQLLESQGRILDSAGTLAGIGATLVGVGVAGVLQGRSLAITAASVFLLVVPIALSVLYAAPRALARKWPERFLSVAGGLVERISRALRLILPDESDDAVGDLAELLRTGSTEDVFDREELRVISGVLSFNQITARELMTPRTDIVATTADASVLEVAGLVGESGFARIPTYGDSLDDVHGMVYAFDLLGAGEGGKLPVRPVSVAPETKRVPDLLYELQKERRQIAVVLDEFGGTAGIVTMEDLLQELVEHLFEDAPGGPESPGDVNMMSVPASMPLEEFCSALGVDLKSADATIGGLLVRSAGRIPRVGERFLLNGVEIDVVAATPTRVESLVARRGGTPRQLLEVKP